MSAARVPLRQFAENVRNGTAGLQLEQIYDDSITAAGKLLSGTADGESNSQTINRSSPRTSNSVLNGGSGGGTTEGQKSPGGRSEAGKNIGGAAAIVTKSFGDKEDTIVAPSALEKVMVAVKKVAEKVTTSGGGSTGGSGGGSLSSSTTSTSTGGVANPALANGKVFTEVASLKSVLSQGLPSSKAPLGGVVLGVSDCFNVAGLRTTNGVRTAMLHHLPEMDDAVVSILRDAGAKFSGKLQSQFPLSYMESAHYDACPAVVAIEKQGCHAAVVSSLGGPGGLVSAANHGMYAFLPTLGALPTKLTNKKLIKSSSSGGGGSSSSANLSTPLNASSSIPPNGGGGGDSGGGEGTSGTSSDGIRRRSHLRNIKYHPTFIAPQMQDLEFMWQSLVEGKKKNRVADGGSSASSPSSGENSSPEKAGGEAGGEADGEKHRDGHDGDERSSSRTSHHHDASSEEDDMSDDEVALTVGIPTQLLHDLAVAHKQDGDRSVLMTASNGWGHHDSAMSWSERLRNRGEAKNQLRSGKKAAERKQIAFQDVEISQQQLDDAFKHTVLITQYDLYMNMKESMELSGGVMDEIPQRLVPAIFAGRQIDPQHYEDSKEAIAELRKEMDEELNEVDVIALPLVGPPFSSGNFRSTMCSLPFSSCGFPLVSLPGSVFASGSGSMKAGLGIGPVQLVGELGADRGLLGDAVLFTELLK